jgi:hypothetical protein
MNNIHIRWIWIIAYHILKNGCECGFGAENIRTIYVLRAAINFYPLERSGLTGFGPGVTKHENYGAPSFFPDVVYLPKPGRSLLGLVYLWFIFTPRGFGETLHFTQSPYSTLPPPPHFPLFPLISLIPSSYFRFLGWEGMAEDWDQLIKRGTLHSVHNQMIMYSRKNLIFAPCTIVYFITSS